MHVIFLDLTHVSEKVNKVRYADFILFWQNLQIEMADQRFRWIFIIMFILYLENIQRNLQLKSYTCIIGKYSCQEVAYLEFF
mgnify:CR=1 FL=1